jgi:cyclopropane fatty-acyl-phospholipid synthase-like methyltransferase
MKIEEVKTWYNKKDATDAFAAMDYVLNGIPYTLEDYYQYVSDPVIKNLELNSSNHVLDIGCGVGVLIDIIAPLVKYIEGFDISSNLINRYKGKQKLSVASIEEYLFEPGKFDRISMVGVSILFPNFSYFKEKVIQLMDALADDGILLITDQRLGDPTSHKSYLTIDPIELITFLQQLRFPYSIKCQSKEKRQILKGRYDIIIYKDKK